jgi:hypothetical protein
MTKKIEVTGKFGRKRKVVVRIGDAEMTFSTVTEACNTLIKACVAVNDWAEDEYQAGRTKRRYVEH